MPLWRCPHCATPQAESSRCWVCHRSTTSCGTCRHFRRGVASGFGTCGLDPRRLALRGSEMRACWTAAAPVDAPPAGAAPAGRPGGDPARERREERRQRTFVPVEELRGTGVQPDPTPAAAAATASPGNAWSLWGDPEA